MLELTAFYFMVVCRNIAINKFILDCTQCDQSYVITALRDSLLEQFDKKGWRPVNNRIQVSPQIYFFSSHRKNGEIAQAFL